MKKHVLWVLLLCLAGCSGINTYNTKPEQRLVLQRRTDLTKWSFQGRLSIKSDEVLSANIRWQHDNETDMLRLAGAFGLGAVIIELNDHEIILDDGQVRQVSQDIDAFIAEQIRFHVPITALRQWILGRHMKEVPVMWIENGFQQLGWRIAYNDYVDTSAGMMPRKIKVIKEKIKLKLVIDQWDIE